MFITDTVYIITTNNKWRDHMKKLILLTATLSLFAMPLAHARGKVKPSKPKVDCSVTRFISLYHAVQAGCAKPKVDCRLTKFSSHQAAVDAGCAPPKKGGKK